MAIATLEYIDNVMDRAIKGAEDNKTFSDAEKKVAFEKSKKIIGGFRVRDEVAEKKALDTIISERMKAIDVFKSDRKALRDMLASKGIAPLAVCPTKAWYKVCRQSGLFIFYPDKHGRIGTERGKFTEKELALREAKFNEFAKKNWSWFLDKLSKDGVFPVSRSDGWYATGLMLPDPPKDVVDILVKAEGFNLNVAAVPDAIRFTDEPYKLAQSSRYSTQDLWARAQGYEDYADWIKRDPIVFMERGSATAVIAQFGDFPIEENIVEQVVKADGWLPDKVNTAAQVVLTTNPLDEQYQRMLTQAELQRQQALSQSLYNGLIGVGRPLTGAWYESADWTGRS